MNQTVHRLLRALMMMFMLADVYKRQDPKSGHPVFVKIGRYGPVVQIGAADDEEKPRFAQLPIRQSMPALPPELLPGFHPAWPEAW